jgi:hypothetical protein
MKALFLGISISALVLSVVVTLSSVAFIYDKPLVNAAKLQLSHLVP